MDLFKPNTNKYCDTIKTSSYEQSITSKNHSDVSYPTLIEVFFSKFDPHISLIDDKQLYVKQRVLEIATEIDENETLFTSFNYNKSVKPSLIQHGLQMNNTISSLLYLSDIYKVSTIVYIESKQIKIPTSVKQRTEFHLLYTSSGKWIHLTDNLPEYIQSDFANLNECLTMDIKTSDIYKKYLAPISKYKVSELIELAKDRQIELIHLGKKKVKKELYDEINLWELNKF
tara:strand:- start:1139 stop:1825 length:687 start_codon:yes stop_codon:yes gene_type:complete